MNKQKLTIGDYKRRCGHSPGRCRYWVETYCQFADNCTYASSGVTFALAASVNDCSFRPRKADGLFEEVTE